MVSSTHVVYMHARVHAHTHRVSFLSRNLGNAGTPQGVDELTGEAEVTTDLPKPCPPGPTTRAC